MKLLQDKNRNRFFIGHLVISLTIITAFCLWVFFVWYPYPLAQAMGVLPILALMTVIDVCVGPVFGFVVYKTDKKTLKMDLAVVILIQLLAFGYGVYSVAKARPVWIVHHSNTFSVVRDTDVQVNLTHNQPSWLGPRWVGYQAPNPLQVLSGDGDIFNAEHYIALSDAKIKGLSPKLLTHYNDEAVVQDTLAKYPNANAWLGLSTTGQQDLVVLIDDKSNQVVATVNLHPWN